MLHLLASTGLEAPNACVLTLNVIKRDTLRMRKTHYHLSCKSLYNSSLQAAVE